MVALSKYVSPPTPIPPPEQVKAAGRAVVEFSGVDQAGPSFEARVFLNNPDAGPDTPMEPEAGYAGSFHVYGYGLWPRHSDSQPSAAATAPPSAMLPMRRSIVATDAVLRAAAKGPTATVTVVPVLPGREAGTEGALRDILTIDGVSISAAVDADDASDAVPPEAGSSQDDAKRE